MNDDDDRSLVMMSVDADVADGDGDKMPHVTQQHKDDTVYRHTHRHTAHSQTDTVRVYSVLVH